MRHFGLTFAAAAALGTFAATDLAVAQQESMFTRDRNVSVLQRARPEYSPTGIRAGSFILRPKVTFGLGYTDNAFAVSSEQSEEFGDQPDSFFLLRPEFRIDSDWNRHAISVGSYIEGREYIEYEATDSQTYGVYGDGRLDVLRNLALTGGAAYDRLYESRTSSNNAYFSQEPVGYDLVTAYGGIEQEFGRIRYRGRLNYRFFDFDDAESLLDDSEIDQDFRDRNEYSGQLQVGYAVTRDASVFLRGTYGERQYEQLNEDGLSRDSQGWRLDGGVDFDITRLARGSIALGYMQEEYDDPSFTTIEGMTVDAGVEWFPRETITVHLDASRGVEASGIPDSGGYLSTDLVAGVDWEMMRNIILSGNIGYGTHDYEDIDREEETYGVSLGLAYLISQSFRTDLVYTYSSQNVDLGEDAAPNVFVNDYDINEILVSFTAER